MRVSVVVFRSFHNLVARAAVFLTGHNIGLFVYCYGMQSNFQSFFLSLKMMLTYLVLKIQGLWWGISELVSVVK